MNKKPFTFKQFKELYSKVPRLTVDLVVQTPSGVVLTLRQLPSWHKLWHLPGGTIFYKETVKQAVKRVAKDELGIAVNIKKLLGYIEYPSEEKERGFGYTISLAILCAIKNGKLKVNKEATQVKIFSEWPKNIVSEQKVFLNKQELI